MDRSSILRASTNSYRQVEKCFYLPFLLLTDTAENRTLCRARALSKREAFVASGRGRRQAAEAGADLRSKYADSPRNAPARYRCDADRASCPGLNPSTDSPYRGESNSMQGAGVKQTRSVCSPRARAAAAGRSRCSKYADSSRKASAQYRCDVYRISAGLAQHQRIPRTAENRTLCRARA